jgi:hypothetical protein
MMNMEAIVYIFLLPGEQREERDRRSEKWLPPIWKTRVQRRERVSGAEGCEENCKRGAVRRGGKEEGLEFGWLRWWLQRQIERGDGVDIGG